MRLTSIGGVDAVERLREQIRLQGRTRPGDMPSNRQIAMVLHALADHTSIMQALNFDPEPGRTRWPSATSVGRFLHAYGDRFDDEG